jgi:hypothetical protein
MLALRVRLPVSVDACAHELAVTVHPVAGVGVTTSRPVHEIRSIPPSYSAEIRSSPARATIDRRRPAGQEVRAGGPEDRRGRRLRATVAAPRGEGRSPRGRARLNVATMGNVAVA